MGIDPSNYLLGLKRFRYIIDRPQIQAFYLVFGIIKRRKKDYRNIFCFWIIF